MVKCIVVTKVRISPSHFCVDNVRGVSNYITLHNINILQLKNWSVRWPIFTARQWSCGKVMFSYMCLSVCQFTGQSHQTINHVALDLTVHGTLLNRDPLWLRPLPWTWDLTGQGFPDPTLSRYGTSLDRWPSLFKLVHFRHAHWCWHLVTIEAGTVSASGQYTSNWNTVL